MGTFLKRISLMEGTLSPKQVVMQCLHVMAEKSCYDDFIFWLWSEDHNANLSRIAKEKVRQRDKGLLSDEQAVRLQKEYAYLYHLALQPGIYFQSLRHTILFEACQQIPGKESALWLELRGFKEALETISTHFFEGLSLLAYDQRDWLNESLDTLKPSTAVAESVVAAKVNEYLQRFLFVAKLSVNDYRSSMSSVQTVLDSSDELFKGCL